MDDKIFYEIIMEGNVDFVRGFITGLLEGKCVPDDVFTGHDYHIEKRGGFGFVMRFLGGRKDVCTVVTGSELKDALLSVIERPGHQIPFKILEIHKIEGSSFSVSFTTYSIEVGLELKELFNNLPEGVLWEPRQDIHEKIEREGEGIEAYTPLHNYELSAKGRIAGFVKGVFILYHKLSKYEVVELGEIKLLLGDRLSIDE